ncbi:MAG: helix-turn-helix transcriptional regulator [Clostridia bacterium]|nr:helix-turn-helix transcriptional regulator [Clostridia bacterium]
MTLSNAVKQRIINLASKKKITLHKLALQSGVPYSTLSSFLNGKCTSITLTTLLHICEGADIGIKDFFNDPLFKNISSDSKIH